MKRAYSGPLLVYHLPPVRESQEAFLSSCGVPLKEADVWGLNIRTIDGTEMHVDGMLTRFSTGIIRILGNTESVQDC